MKLLDKAKAAAEQAAVKAKEGVEDVQTKRELHATYGELGEKTFELVDAGALDRPEFATLVQKIRDLKVKLAEETPAAADPGAETSSQPPAMPT
jgi:hypothetical protein